MSRVHSSSEIKSKITEYVSCHISPIMLLDCMGINDFVIKKNVIRIRVTILNFIWGIKQGKHDLP